MKWIHVGGRVRLIRFIKALSISSLLTLFGVVIGPSGSAFGAIPAIQVTSLPGGGDENGVIIGKVINADFRLYKLACLIRVNGLFYSKPTCASKDVRFDASGRFSIRTVSGGDDSSADAFHLFLLPLNFDAECVLGLPAIPDAFFLQSIAQLETNRVVSTLNWSVFYNGVFATNSLLQGLKIGQRYFIEGVSPNGCFFDKWSGDITSSRPRLTFTMRTNLYLELHYVCDRFIGVRGLYSGLFFEQSRIVPESAGSFRLAISLGGSFSGKLLYRGVSYPLSGTFGADGQSTSTVLTRNASTLTVQWQLNLTNGNDNVSGTITDGRWVANLEGDRNVFNKTMLAAAAGYYTFIIPGEPGSEQVPAGDGFGSAIIAADGTARLAGKLADGTPFTATSAVSKHGQIPFFLSLNSGKGLLASWVIVSNDYPESLVGSLNWVKPASGTATSYRSGFSKETSIIGSLYLPPLAGQSPILGLIDGEFAFADGNLPSPFTNHVTLSSSSRVTNLGSNKLRASINPKTGILDGTVQNPSSGKILSFQGVALSREQIVRGYFLGTNQSGSMDFRARRGSVTVPRLPSIASVNGRQLMVRERLRDGTLAELTPFVIRGVNWSPAGKNTLTSKEDPNNAKIRRQEFGKWYSTDIPLMKAMNVNTIRLFIDPGYEPSLAPTGRAILDMLYTNGIKVVMTVDDAINDTNRARLVINFYKDHPAVLMWSIGSEWNMNLYFRPSEIPSVPEAAERTELAAQLIKSIDTNHPIASSLGEIDIDVDGLRLSDTKHYVTSVCPGVDVWSLNIYRGKTFGSVFQDWATISAKPMFVGEFGVDAFHSSVATLALSGSIDEAEQSEWCLALWDAIQGNLSARDPNGVALGGALFEWNDEWWKVPPATAQNPGGGSAPGFPDDFANEEYFGIVDIDRGPRKVYQTMKTAFDPSYVPAPLMLP